MESKRYSPCIWNGFIVDWLLSFTDWYTKTFLKIFKLMK